MNEKLLFNDLKNLGNVIFYDHFYLGFQLAQN